MTKDKEQDKVIYLNQGGEKKPERDSEMASLLALMRKMRAGVPVNHQLKEKLRQQLLQQQLMIKKNQESKSRLSGQNSLRPEAGRREKKVWLFQWALFLLPLLMIISGIFYFLAGEKPNQAGEPAPYREEREIFIDSFGTKGFSASINSQGKLYFINRGSLWLMDYDGQQQEELLQPDPGQVFRYAALSQKENQLVVIAEGDGKSSLLILDLADLTLKTLFQSQPGEALLEAVWSPDSSKIAFTKTAGQGEEAVYQLILADELLKPRLISAGSHPSWSPDGRQLALQRLNASREEEIWLVSADESGEAFWGVGGQPHWSGKGQLAFIKERRWEKVLSYSSEGEPQLISDQRVREVWVANVTGEIKVNLTQLPGPTPEDEARLLREWEKQGDRELKTLELRGRIADNHPQWSPDGSFLIVERNHGTHSSLLWVKVGGLQ